jgi:hypothetical protein
VPRLPFARSRVDAATERRRLAESLELAVERGGRPVSPFTAVVPITAQAAGAARAPLLDLAERLRQPRPVRPEGLRIVRWMLTDGAGPLYAPASPGHLRRIARRALEALEPDAHAG